MIFDEKFLASVGLSKMPEGQKGEFLEYLTHEAEYRVGTRVMEGLPEEKVDEFDRCATDEEALKWLEENRPNFREVVDAVGEEIKKAVENNRDRLLAGI